LPQNTRVGLPKNKTPEKIGGHITEYCTQKACARSLRRHYPHQVPRVCSQPYACAHSTP
jgi:hypothetical protein